jgi:hypothetical protein
MIKVQMEDMAAGTTGDRVIVTENLDVLPISGAS